MASTSVVFDILARDRASDKFDKVGNAAAGSTSKMGKLSGVLKTVGKAAAVGLAGAGLAAIKFGSDSVKAASNAQQSIGATQTVFGKFAKTVIDDSNRAAKQYGLSANEYRENANLIGSLFKNQGVAADQLAGKTKGMIGTASDLAATFGGTTKEAVEALGSAFKGEFDPLEKYGISLKQSTVNTEAMRVAHVKSTADFEKLTIAQQTAAKQQATNNLISKQSADAAGAFARESDTLAHKQQVLAAQFDNVKVMAGNALLPVLTEVAGFISDKVVPAARDFIDGMKNGEGAGGQFADALGKVRDVLHKVWDVLKPVIEFILDNKTAVATFAGVILTVAAAVKVWAGAQTLLNLAMDANPLGIVIVAVAALAAGLVIAYKKSETFREIVSDTMAVCSKVFKSFWNDFAQPILHFLVEALAVAAEGFADLLDGLSHVPGFGWIKDVANGLHVAADQGHAVADSIRKIPEHKTVNVDVVVNTSAISKVQHQLETLGNTSGRLSANGRTGGGPFGLGGNNVGGPGAALIDSIVNGISKGKVKLQTALDKLKDYVQKQQDKLGDLLSKRAAIVDAFKGFASSLFSTNLSVGEGEAPKGIQALLDFQKQQRAKAEQLRTDVGTLISKGISQDLLTQLQNAGEAGEEQIHLLASGTVDEIRQANADNAATLQALQDAGLAASKAQGIEEAIKQEERDIKLADTIRDKLQELLDLQDKNTIVELHLDGQKIYVSLKKLKKQLGHGLDLD